MTHPTREQQIRRPRARTGPRTRAGRASSAATRAADVVRLRGSVPIEHTLARRGAEKLWNLVNTEPFVNTLGALTGNQAMQQVKAGLKAIYLSGWQVAGDANIAGEMYPDQSLYPVELGADRSSSASTTPSPAPTRSSGREGKDDIDFFAPIVADAEAGFGGVLNAFELMKAMIEAGAAGVHFEDQLASVKKCGHMGGKVLVPTREAVAKLTAARLAADVMGVPTLVIARTDAEAADLVTSDVDDNDKPFLTGERTVEGFYRTRARPRAGGVARPGLLRSTPTWSGARPASPTSPSPRPSPRRSTRSSRASCWPTTARRASTGRRTSTTRRSPSSSASSARWATSSSSSRWPASTA